MAIMSSVSSTARKRKRDQNLMKESLALLMEGTRVGAGRRG